MADASIIFYIRANYHIPRIPLSYCSDGGHLPCNFSSSCRAACGGAALTLTTDWFFAVGVIDVRVQPANKTKAVQPTQIQ